jgi:predicted AlkP superfamily phosphohydrolase/phosphomutase
MAIDKVAIIGLDCGEPSLVFERWRDLLPNMRRLMRYGRWGRMRSCIPPITVPAWSCMATSKDPGVLGTYGFRNRKDYSYEGLEIATSLQVKEPRIWDVLSNAGRPSIILGVPQTYPITRPPTGAMVACWLTPDITCDYTWPRDLKDRIRQWVGEYILDVKGFRSEDKDSILRQIYEMTKKRFELSKRLLREYPWSLFWMVEMGVDRIHHAFWSYMDPKHHRYTPGHKYADAIRDYYIYLDMRMGELLGAMDLDRTAVWVVSDHGAQCMEGGICFNDWLIREGYLVLKDPPFKPTKFRFDLVDWTKTTAWGEGGYYGRCFINVEGREPHGLVPKRRYDAFCEELIAKLESMKDEQGRRLGTKVYRPGDVYETVNGIAPDLIVLFGNLRYRSVGSVGNPSIFTLENDTGPDDANHAADGMYILSHPSLGAGRRDDKATLYDVMPTTLAMLDIPPAAGLKGKTLIG